MVGFYLVVVVVVVLLSLLQGWLFCKPRPWSLRALALRGGFSLRGGFYKVQALVPQGLGLEDSSRGPVEAGMPPGPGTGLGAGKLLLGS